MRYSLMEVNIELIRELRTKGKFLEAQELFNKYQEVAKNNLAEGKVASAKLNRLLYEKKYHFHNKEKRNAASRRYFWNNREKCLANQKKWQSKNSDKLKEYRKRYNLKKKMETQNGSKEIQTNN